MRHHILVKWDTTQPRPDLRAIDQLFQQTLEIPGIHSVSLHPNVVARPNRYDLLILLCMERDALAAYDASEAHARWKAEYGARIAQKAIFDCE